MKKSLTAAAAAALLATACATPYAPAPLATHLEASKPHQIGRASCRERG